MKLILLSGHANTGKTTTLNTLIHRLWETNTTDFIVSPKSTEDPLCVVGKYHGNKIGIITMGDPTTEPFVQKSIKECIDCDCNIIIGATRTKGRVLNIYKDLALKQKSSFLQLHTITGEPGNKTLISRINNLQVTTIIELINILTD